MKVVILNCFETFEERVDLIKKFFDYTGYDVTVIQSNFQHIKKQKRFDEKEKFIFVDTKPYYKNISFKRILSHHNFAKKAMKFVEDINPNILYVVGPPNSLFKYSAKYKSLHNDVKLIFDVMDLWPETMPIGKVKKVFPFTIWKNLRDKSLKYSDLLITECDLYKKVLHSEIKNLKQKTIYLSKVDNDISKKPVLSKDDIHLCYLGSINNIIDIQKIKLILKAVNEIRPVVFHIIGDGENRENLINEVNRDNIKVKYYGKIYNSEEKQKIFNKCHFGLNIMKDDVCVGLTLKSMDYFQAGLPIINNIKYDTEKIVNKYDIGINFNEVNINNFKSKIEEMNEDDFIKMRKNTLKVFNKLFSIESFNKNLLEVLKEI